VEPFAGASIVPALLGIPLRVMLATGALYRLKM
jgi:hypothetical protein